MTEDFKKGLATGIAIGGVTINKPPLYGIKLASYVKPLDTPPPLYQALLLTPPTVIVDTYIAPIPEPPVTHTNTLNTSIQSIKTGKLI